MSYVGFFFFEEIHVHFSCTVYSYTYIRVYANNYTLLVCIFLKSKRSFTIIIIVGMKITQSYLSKCSMKFCDDKLS